MNAFFETANCAAAPIAHVVEVDVKDGKLDETARRQDAPGLGDDVPILHLRPSRWEPEDDRRDALRAKGKLFVKRRVSNLVMVGRAQGEGRGRASVVRCWERCTRRQIEECCCRVCLGGVERPVIIAQAIDNKNGGPLKRSHIRNQLVPYRAEEDMPEGEPFADSH